MNKRQIIRLLKQSGLWERYSAMDAYGKCSTSTMQGEVFEFLTSNGCPVHSCMSEDDNNNGHAYMTHIDPNSRRAIIIDPTIRQFCPNYPGIFVGSREELKTYVLSPDTVIENTKSRHEPLRAFQRTWGEKGWVKVTAEQARQTTEKSGRY